MAYVIASIMNKNNFVFCRIYNSQNWIHPLFFLVSYRNIGKGVYGLDGVAKTESHFHDEPNWQLNST